MSRRGLLLCLIVFVAFSCEGELPGCGHPVDAVDDVDFGPSVDVPNFEGFMQVDVQSFGVDIPDSVTAHVGSQSERLPARGGSHRFTVANGTHQVSLTVQPNCSVSLPHPRSVAVASRETKVESFRLDCVTNHGDVRAQVETFGAAGSTTGYRVQVSGVAQPQPIPLNGNVTFSGVPAGSRDVQLLDVPPFCSVLGANPVRVTVVFRSLVVAPFQVACAGQPGMLRVETHTTGTDLDPDGYLLEGAGSQVRIGTNAVHTYGALQGADYVFELLDVAPNCAVAPPNRRLVTVRPAQVDTTQFRVICQPLGGSVDVRTATTGNAPDPDGYTVQVGQTQRPIGANATQTLTGVPVGSATVTLSGLAPNCGVVAPNPKSVTVTVGTTSALLFEVACPGPTPAVVFESERTGNLDVFVMNPDGSGAVNLTQNGAEDDDPSWSWDNTRIAFRSTRSGPSAIWVMNADGSNPRQLTLAGANEDGDPAFSPDGSRIVFGRRVADGTSEIFVMHANGDSIVQLTNAAGSSEGPVFSPDGKQILFKSDRVNGQDDVFVMNANGTQQVALTGPTSDDFDPAWSPDGQLILFSTNRDGAETLYLMDAQGNNERGFVVPAQFNDWNPVFSTDGTQVVFTSDRQGAPELWRVNVTGSGLIRLTNSGTSDDDAEFKKKVVGSP
jgi:TolB protein